VEAGVVDLTGEGLPSDLRTTLIRRLSWLSAEVVELLRLASLLGGTFTLRDLATVTGRSVVDVAARLQDASQAGLIIGEGDRLAFRHDLIREAIYTDMAPAVRSDLHRAAGQALAAQGAPVTQIAQQFALGARPGDLDAVSWLERAGTEALAVSPSSALTLFEQALDLAPATWPGRAALQARMIEPLAGCGRFDEGEAMARIVLDSSPDPDVEFTALRGLTSVLGNRGDIAASIEALHTAAKASGAPPGEARIQRGLAGQLSILMGSGADEARVAAEEALIDAIAAGDEGLACLSHQTLGVAAMVSGYDEDALAHMSSALALLDSGRLPWNSYLIPDFWVSICLAVLDRTEEAAVAARKTLLRAEQEGSISTIPYGYLAAGYPQILCGHFDDAVVNFTAALSVMDETQNNNFVLYGHAILATVALRHGDIATATDHLTSGAQWLSSGAAPFGADMLFGAQTEFLVASGQDEAALTVAEATWVQTASIRYLLSARGRAALLVRLAVAAGRVDLAQEVTEAIAEGARRSPALSVAAAARRCRGLLDRDPEALLEAVALLRKTPLRPDLAACCEDAAVVLAERDRRDEAVALLDEAATIHVDIGATGDLARVDARLRTLGARRRRRQPERPTSGWDALTRMERQVTDLVAEGLTNPEIGSRLYISRRTVETHLSHVFAKLGVSSRAQVAAEAARREG
jgi:DNA-binding CsgD family transcriptional regulator/tetratricopeptide (TPR) repeat protein